MAHGPSWYRAMGGIQSRPTGRRVSSGALATLGSLGSLGDDTLSTPTVGADQITKATVEWQHKVLDALNRGSDTLTLQRWLQIAATLSIPLAAAAWKAIWPSLGRRFRGTGTEAP